MSSNQVARLALAIAIGSSALPLVVGLICGQIEVGLKGFWYGFRGGVLTGYMLEGGVVGVLLLIGLAVVVARG